MANLTIRTDRPLGPLTVEVFGPRGERVTDPITLSSVFTQTDLQVSALGDYTIVATRPSGERLISTAPVAARGGEAVISPAGRSPHEFLTEEASFGLTFASGYGDAPDFNEMARTAPRAANTAAKSVSVLWQSKPALARFRTDLSPEPVLPASVDHYVLVGWEFAQDSWSKTPLLPPIVTEDYLQLRLNYGGPTAIGLLHRETGFGPIVVVPPFREGVDVTFLAAGADMTEAADRTGNPSTLRVPVALSAPRQLGLADLLVGLNAQVLPDASKVLTGGRSGSIQASLDVVAEKFEDPAAAILGALFLARFAPMQLPMAWLRNLNRLRPDYADTWVLLAWARSFQGDGDHDWTHSIADQLREAQARRCTLFSRSRFQLGKFALRYGPFPRARQEEVFSRRRYRVGDYLDYAADAGGLEAFWGTGPSHPGFSRQPTREAFGFPIGLANGRFF